MVKEKPNITGALHVECPIKCGYCCTHMLLGPIQCLLPDDIVRDKMGWISDHGKPGLITCRRTIDGFDIKIDEPCKHYDLKTHLCKVWGTSEQHENCKSFLCDKARNRLAIEEYKKEKSSRIKVRENGV